jgi:putative ABC transport system permease protein
VEEGAGKADSVYEIAGMVENTKYNEFGEHERSIAFFPVDQDKDLGADRNFVIRTRGPAGGLESAIQRALASLDSNLLVDFRVLDVQIQESVLRERLMASLSVAFGILAGCLSTLGLYGVMSYLVARRRNEIGLRVALGATRSNVYRLIAKDAAMMVGTGLLVGVTASLLLSRFAESLLFELKAKDPPSLILAGVVLATSAAVATLVPARRAAQLDPITALREE